MKLHLDFNGIKSKTPEILLFSGIAEWAVGTFFACKGTLKAKQDLDERKADTDKKKLAVAIDICKDYLPAALCIAAGTTSICASHGIMKNRYTNLVAAYGTLTASFMEYRSRVREEVGAEKEEELYYGTSKEMVSVKVTQKDGKERKVNKKVDVRTRNGLSPYAQKLDSKVAFGTDNPYYVDTFLQRIESNLNENLMAFGHVYLNEARKELGLDRDDVGQLVGWLYDPNKCKDGDRDNYICITKKNICVKEDDGDHVFETWVDFNVDGVIFGKMSKEEYNTSVKELGDQGLEFSNKED